MVLELDEIIYAALTADPVLSILAGGIHSTCIEVPPTDADNTPLPYILRKKGETPVCSHFIALAPFPT